MRKNVKNLTDIRHEVSATARDMHESSIDLEAGLCEINDMSPEQIRSDKAAHHAQLFKDLKRLHSNIGKLILRHSRATIQLQSFF